MMMSYSCALATHRCRTDNHHRQYTRILLLFVLLLAKGITGDPQDQQQNASPEDLPIWNELVAQCRADMLMTGSGLEQMLPDVEDISDEPSIGARPIRRVGSEFLGKRSPGAGPIGQQIVSFCRYLADENAGNEAELWLCKCLLRRFQDYQQSTHENDLEEEKPLEMMEKRGPGSILLSGKRMTNKLAAAGQVNRRTMASEFLGKRAMGSEFLGKRAMGSEFLGKRAMGSEFLGKRAMGSEFLGKRAMGSEFLGKRAMGSEFLGKRAMGNEFLGKRAMGSEFLGKRAMGSEFLGKRSADEKASLTEK